MCSNTHAVLSPEQRVFPFLEARDYPIYGRPVNVLYGLLFIYYPFNSPLYAYKSTFDKTNLNHCEIAYKMFKCICMIFFVCI